MPIATASPCGRPVSVSMAWPKLWPKLSKARCPLVSRSSPATSLVLARTQVSMARSRASASPASRAGAIRLAPGEEIGIVDQAVFDDLGIAGAQLAFGESGERRRIDQHQRGGMEGADQVLALGRVDPGLAADRGVGLGEQAGRHRHPVAAALQQRRGEARHVADHAAADRHDMVGPPDPGLHHRIEQSLDRGERLARLARRQHEAAREIRSKPVRPTRRRDIFIGDQEETASRARPSRRSGR